MIFFACFIQPELFSNEANLEFFDITGSLTGHHHLLITGFLCRR